MLAADSILRHLPSGLVPRQRVVLDGIRYCAEISSLASTRLRDVLQRITESEVTPVPQDWYVAAFSDAWSFVDASNRLRPLLLQLPGARDAVAVQRYLELTEAVRAQQDGAQHLQARLDGLVASATPVMGHLTRTAMAANRRSATLHCLVAGCLIDFQFEMPTVTRDCFVPGLAKIALNAHGVTVDFAPVLQAMDEVCTKLEEILTERAEPNDRPGADFYIRMNVSLVDDEAAGNDT